jgi:hypothetical protein
LSTVATSPGRLRDDLVGLVHRGADVRNFALGVAGDPLSPCLRACRRGVDRYGIGGILEPTVATVIAAEHFGGTASLEGVS